MKRELVTKMTNLNSFFLESSKSLKWVFLQPQNQIKNENWLLKILKGEKLSSSKKSDWKYLGRLTDWVMIQAKKKDEKFSAIQILQAQKANQTPKIMMFLRKSMNNSKIS